ncbi:MAG: aldo/keto reductase [Syntrophorhabdales bacterium]|jgi:predicted aldo/keto reductase-like oxidoreductase
MEKIRLGRTGLIVTRMGWGGIPIQRVGEIEAVSVIRAVVGMGVDLLDSARAYTNSEHRIGLALEGLDRPVVLSTKSQEKTARIYDEVHESLRQLKAKKIDIYHVHMVSNIEEYERVMAPGGAYEGLLRARDEGLIDHIGLTSHNLDVLVRAVGDGLVSVIMACYGFLEPEAATKVFPLARAKDIGILAMKTFSGGVVEEAGPALRYVLSAEGIVPIPGSETLEKARENWRIFSEGGLLTEQDKERIEAIRKEFDQKFCRRCDYCQPCTEGISIQLIMGLKTTIKRFGSQMRELPWMTEGIEKARNCSECGECLKRCPYSLPIPDLIKENLSLYDSIMKG